MNISEIYKYAKENDIPIMQDDGIEFLLDFIKNNNIKKVLEIGTAIGYSSIRMASLDDSIKVVSIEREKSRYDIALNNIKGLNLLDRITLILDDAMNVSLNDMFDLIFIDASKSQNIKFFEKFKHNLNKDGFIITDNLSFHGMVEKDLSEIESRNVRGLVRKIRNYISFLKDNKEFKTEFYSIGDGISVSKRNGD